MQTARSSGRLVGGSGQRQVQLPLRKAAAIAIQSIRVRFWRSMITAAGVLLGIAFLSATFTQSIIENHTPLRNEQGLSAEQKETQKREAEMRRNWLVGMSLIVCTVGIANSMLMSVTERFKEIGTMKCLGALDTFVVKLFLLEACGLGVIASFVGFIVGCVGALLIALIQLGNDVWERLPAGELLVAFVWSMVAGTVLTVVATIFPAVQAAKLPPAAALRSEI
jgi:putative ABC transport system permease protein